jgi:hypothetical protein
MTQDAGRSAAMRVAAAAAVCAMVVTGAGVAAAASGGTWGRAREVPGTAALNHDYAQVNSVSCASAGNCAAGGSYIDSSLHTQAFVASEVNGTWHTAIEVPGTGALNQGGQAQVNSVSCASAGNCAAGGLYFASAGGEQAFVASEVNGTWHTAREVPGTAALNQRGGAEALSVSCVSAGNCAVGGFYSDSFGNVQAFVASEVNGIWHTAREVPGTAALNHSDARVLSVSCASVGNCAAGGWYTDSFGNVQAFVASEVNGTWHTAIEVPGTAGLNHHGDTQVNSVSCASAGNCSAGGSYTDSAAKVQAFVASEVNGTWHTASEVPGTAALNQDGAAQVNSVSCASAGNCAAAGFYTDSSRNSQAFVASEVNGTWHAAIEVPGTAALNQNGNARAVAVSCASAGNCAAGGWYTGSSRQAFVTSEVNGTWHTAIEVPGTAALNQGGNALVDTVSCAMAGNCAAAGFYTESSQHLQAFVVNQT